MEEGQNVSEATELGHEVREPRRGQNSGLESHGPGFMLHPVDIKELKRFLWGTR